MLSRISVRRPIGVAVLVIVLLVLGYISLGRLGVDLLPDITYPVVSIVTTYKGVSPEEMEKMVTKPIEETVSSVARVKKVSSRTQEEISVVIVEFEWGTNMDFAAQDIRDELDFLKRFLPDDIEKPIVIKFNPNMMPVQIITFYGMPDLMELRYFLENEIIPKLERIDGVAAAFPMGGMEREINVDIDKEKLEAYNIPLEQVIAAVGRDNWDVSAGRLVKGYLEYSIRSKGELKKVSELENIVVSSQTGALVYLRDIARVNDTHKEIRSYSRMEGLEGTALGIQKQSGTNTVQISKIVTRELKKFKKTFPPGLRAEVVFDQAEYIKSSIVSLGANMIYGGILAMVVIFIFLVSIRSTIIIGLAIPISVMITFIPIYFQGFTLNTMSLGGLTIAVGMLVDNAIVVLENIYRHMQEGRPPLEAGEIGGSEVGGAILASTLTNIAVFLPVAYVGGIAGKLFGQLGWTVTFSLFASLLMAYTLVPMMTSRLVKPKYLADEEKGLFKKIKDFYAVLLKSVIKRRGFVLLTVFGIFAVSIVLVFKVGTEFMGKSDEGEFMIELEMHKGTKLEETDRVTKQIEHSLRKIPEVRTVASRVGIEEEMQGFGTAWSGRDEGAHTSIVFVHLKDREHRRGKLTNEIIDDARKKIAPIKGIDKRFKLMSQLMQTVGGVVEIDIIGDDISTLGEISQKVEDKIKNVKGIRDVSSSLTKGTPEIQIKYDREKSASHGFSVAQLGELARSAVLGKVASRFRTGDDEIDIRVKLEEEDRNTIDDIKNIPVFSPFGTKLHLGDISDIVYSKGPSKLERENQKRIAKITADISGRPLGDIMKDVMAKVAKIHLPHSYFISYGGQYEQMKDVFSNLGLALGLAIFLVYSVMAVQFESLLQPFIIMFTVPLAFIGTSILLFLTKTTISLISVLGIIMLVGVVVNNAIVMLDYVNQLRAGGMGLEDALIKGGQTRLRPILITSLTTIFGMLPLALGIGEGAETSAPMGIAFIGGMVSSTFLTLFIIPIVYYIFINFSLWIKRAKN